MDKKDWLKKDLLEGLEGLARKLQPERDPGFVKNCANRSLQIIEAQAEDDIDFGFFETLAQQVSGELRACPELQNLPEAKNNLLQEELEVIFQALDYRYSGGEPEAAMREDLDEASAEPESIEPWWDDEDNA